MKEIFISDLSSVLTPDGWNEARIDNKIRQGWTAAYDYSRMGWVLTNPSNN